MKTVLTFTVAIVTRNQASRLAGTLESICRQTVQPDRVMVVDNGSTDDTSIVCKRFTEKLPLERHVCEKVGVNVGRNQALQLCSTDILVFIDDDAVAKTDWLETIAEHFECSGETDVVVGVKDNYYIDSIIATVIQFMSRDLSMMRDRNKTVILSPTIVDTCNLALKIEPVRSSNIVFDNAFLKGGDRHFGYRLLQAGVKVDFCELAIVLHKWPRSLFVYVRMRWRAGIASKMLFHACPGYAAYRKNTGKAGCLEILRYAFMRSKRFGLPGFITLCVLAFAGKTITALAGFRYDMERQHNRDHNTAVRGRQI